MILINIFITLHQLNINFIYLLNSSGEMTGPFFTLSDFLKNIWRKLIFNINYCFIYLKWLL